MMIGDPAPLCQGEFDVVIMIEVGIEEMHVRRAKPA
jgi:hypothetical protein